MTCPNTSLVKMDPKEVVHIAEKYLAWAKARKETRYKETMDKIRASLKKRMNSRWCWWLRRDPTEEEVMYEFSKENDGGWRLTEKYMIDLSYATGEKISRDLIKGAKNAIEMYVSVEDLARIS